MGDNPATSVTNRHGQVHGVQGLYVADNSVLPTLTGAGPTLSGVALAVRCGGFLFVSWDNSLKFIYFVNY